ncbi:hypothetical protein [Rhizobium sp.]
MPRRIFHVGRRVIFPRLDGGKDLRASSVMTGMVVIPAAIFTMATVIERTLGGG